MWGLSSNEYGGQQVINHIFVTIVMKPQESVSDTATSTIKVDRTWSWATVGQMGSHLGFLATMQLQKNQTNKIKQNVFVFGVAAPADAKFLYSDGG